MSRAAQADPHLLQWICDTLGRTLETPADLGRITKLEAEYFRWGAPRCPDWLTLAPGDWSLIGELPNLERLEFPNIPDAGMRYSQTRCGPTKFCWSDIESYSFLLKLDACYLPRSPGQGEEPAPPRLGGQSPVPKSQAVGDLTLAAGCVRHYIRSGKLPAKLTWEREN